MKTKMMQSNRILAAGVLAIMTAALGATTAGAEYQKIAMTVFGMDCAPCAHAIRVSMKGIHGVSAVDVDLNTGLVQVQLEPGNSVSMRQINDAVERNGFTHKEATVTLLGRVTGTATAPVLEVVGSTDRFALAAATPATEAQVAALLGKSVMVTGTMPVAPKGKVPDALRTTSLQEAK